MSKKFSLLGQATLEYVLITLLLAAVVFFGFMSHQKAAQDGGVSRGNNFNFVETSRMHLEEFTGAATQRINNESERLSAFIPANLQK